MLHILVSIQQYTYKQLCQDKMHALPLKTVIMFYTFYKVPEYMNKMLFPSLSSSLRNG